MVRRLETMKVSGKCGFSFGIPPAKSTLFLPKILKVMREKNPDVAITVVEEKSDKLEEMIADALIDIALISTPLANNAIPFRIIASEELFFAVSTSYPMRAEIQKNGEKRWLSPRDAAGEQFILQQSGKLRMTFNSIFQSAGFSPNIRYSTSDTSVALEMARNGLGIVLVSAEWISQDDYLEYLPLSPDGLFREIVMIYSRLVESDKTIKSFERETSKVIRSFRHK
jgi:DNA-binding transcriptional LysR family regulator